MSDIVNTNNEYKPVRDRIPVPTKISYGLGTGLNMWGLWLYPGVAFAVFNIYLGVDPRLVGLVLTLIRVYDAIVDPVVGWISDNLRSISGQVRLGRFAPHWDEPVLEMMIGSTLSTLSAANTQMLIAGKEPDKPTAILLPSSTPILFNR